MVLAIGMMAFSVSLCWGLLGDKYLVLASVYAWDVTAALRAVLIAPGSAAAYWLDMIGSLIVALYLIRCGIRTVCEERNTVSSKMR